MQQYESFLKERMKFRAHKGWNFLKDEEVDLNSIDFTDLDIARGHYCIIGKVTGLGYMEGLDTLGLRSQARELGFQLAKEDVAFMELLFPGRALQEYHLYGCSLMNEVWAALLTEEGIAVTI